MQDNGKVANMRQLLLEYKVGNCLKPRGNDNHIQGSGKIFLIKILHMKIKQIFKKKQEASL